MIQPQEQTKEPQEETQGKFYVSDEDVNDEFIEKEKRKFIHLWKIQKKKLEERKEGSHLPMEGIKEKSSKQMCARKRHSNSSNELQKHIKDIYIQRNKNAH